MPQRVICYGCRYVLYDAAEFNSIDEIIQLHAETCPRCGRKLSHIPLGIEVTPVNK
jgi:predicted  nucleic acid-binding Zn-ribbon protein